MKLAKGKVIAILVAIVLVGLGTGALTGFWYSLRPRMWLQSSRNILAWTCFSVVYGPMVGPNTGYKESKSALIETLAFEDRASAQEDRLLGRNNYYVDTGLIYGRLALLEESNGHQDRMNGYFREAGKRLQSAGWRDVSERRIRETLAVLDRGPGDQHQEPK